MRHLRWSRRLLALAGSFALAGVAFASPVVYDVNVDTVAGTGYLDFQFNPGSGAAGATATISGFELIGGGSLLPPVDVVFPLPFNTPTASGSLGTQVTISNADSLNAFLQRVELASGFRFILTLAGPALDTSGNGGGTDFSLFRYDVNGTDAVGGPLALFQITGDGGVLSSTADGVTLGAVPEPSSLLTLAAALTLVGFGAYRRAR